MNDVPLLSMPPAVARRLRESEFRVVITGASGWLGQVTLEMLDQCLGESFRGRVSAFGHEHRELSLRSGRRIPCLPLSDLAVMRREPCFLLNFAFLTRDFVAGMPASDFIARNQSLSAFVAEQAARLEPAGLFVPSSGAVYRADRSIDQDLERNPYGVLKARDEARFRSLGDGGRTRVVQCRVFNIAGPFINKLRTYALASILLDIAAGGPVQLKASRLVERSYFHVGNLIELAFALLLDDAPPAEAFDTAGERVVEVGELAHLAASLLGRPNVAIQRPPLGDGAADRYVGDQTVLKAIMAKHGIVPAPLETQILDTAAFLSKSAISG
jgi:UDP-glucuronate decarboxylase